MPANTKNTARMFTYRFTAICFGLLCTVGFLVLKVDSGKPTALLFGLTFLAVGFFLLGWWSTRTFKQLQQQHKKYKYTQARLAAIVDSSEDAILSKDLNGVIQTWNIGAERLYGYTAEEIIGKNVSQLVPTGQKNEIPEILKRLKQGEVIGHYESWRLTKSGETIPMSLCISPVRDSQGQIIAASAVARDMRAYHAALKKIQESEAHLSALMSNMMGMVYRADLDADRTMRYVSHGSLELLGLFPEDLIDSRTCTYASLIHSDDLPGLQEKVADAARQGRPYNVEYRVKAGLDQWKWVRERGRTICLLDQKKNMLEGLIVDITDQKNAEMRIRELNDRLESRVEERTRELEVANQELEAFCYSVSHDLRSPLRGLYGFSQALLEDYPDRLDEKGTDYLNRIRSASQHMGTLIDELLELSRMSRAEMHRQPLDLTAMAQDRISHLRDMESNRSVDVRIQEGMVAFGDPTLISVVLMNLLDNAWKFTAKTVQPVISFDCRTTLKGTAFCVQDNGAGFDMAYADQLFVAFQRLHKASEFPGTGIGLTTVQRILRRHGGEIWANAKPDEGSMFFFTLKIQEEQSDG